MGLRVGLWQYVRRKHVRLSGNRPGPIAASQRYLWRLKRLLDEIETGAIDAVVVYKVDRLSRSLLDFARHLTSAESISSP